MNNVYLDIDSSYRNRKLWPLPGEFEILIAQTGNKEKGNAYDPVCLSEPVAVWSCNALTTSAPSTFQIPGIISAPQIYGNSGYNQVDNSLTLIFNNIYFNNSVQTIEDYYVGLIFWNVTNTQFSRITSYKFIGDFTTSIFYNGGNLFGIYSKGLITIESPINFNFGDSFCITDATDLTDPDYPLFFVPNGKNQNDAYLNYLLYCETNNDYRKITKYTSLSKYLSCESWENINDPIYQQYGNFCIRKEAPLFPGKLENSLTPLSINEDFSIIQVQTPPTCSLSKITNFYKNDFLRLRQSRPQNYPVNFLTKIIAGGTKNGVNKNLALSTNGLNWDFLNQNKLDIIYGSIVTLNTGSLPKSLFSIGKTSTNTHSIVYTTDYVGWSYVVADPFIGGFGRCINTQNDTLFSGGEGSTYTFAMSDDFFVTSYNKYNPFGTPFASGGSGIGGSVYSISPFFKSFGQPYVMVAGYNSSDTSISTIIIGERPPGGGPGIVWSESSNNPFQGGVATALYGNTVNPSTTNSYSIAVGYNDIKTICISISYDYGVTWTSSDDNPFLGGEGIAISWNGKYWLAGGYNDSLTVTTARSTDGLKWENSKNNGFQSGKCTSIVWSGSYWVAGGYSLNSVDTVTAIATSPDGLIWTPIINTSDLFNIYTLIYINNDDKDPIFYNIYSKTIKSQSRQITSYECLIENGVLLGVQFTVYPLFDIGKDFSKYTIEIEKFSYDNCNPFTYIGTLLQQQSCYEIDLIELVLPNFTLSSGFGSKIAFYPYVYVEISNVSASSSRLKNIIYSNNPNISSMIFKVPIDDVQDPLYTPYVRLTSAYMIQTVKFRPNDNLYFKVLLPNGDIFNTLLIENYSPKIVNDQNQVSCKIAIKRI